MTSSREKCLRPPGTPTRSSPDSSPWCLTPWLPFTHLLEAEQRGGPPTWEEAKEAVVAATELVGNASAKMTHLMREKVTTDLNKALLPVAKEETNFKTAPLSLFGTEFAKKAKDHIDQVKAMRAVARCAPRVGCHNFQLAGDSKVFAATRLYSK